ncbi:MAG: hypothetical protein R3C60_12570 [Parvularculaceae bacterium]
MIDSIRDLIMASPLAAVAVSFLAGGIFGALMSRSGDAGDEEVVHKAGSDAVDGDPKEIVVIRAELEAARSLLDDGEEQDEEIRSQLSALDEAVNRANGRLKLLLKSIRKVKPSE